MRFKVILFCALLFGSKFVVPIPFDEEFGRQRAIQSNSWQGKLNTASGSDFTRTHSLNAMTNSAQQFPIGQEYYSKRGRQHSENYDNHSPHSLHSLSKISNPVNVASGGTNEHRKNGFVSRVDSFPIRNQHLPIRVDNQYKQQNWQSHNRFENPTTAAIDSVATSHERPLSVHKPFHNSGQVIQSPPVNRQHYQGDNLHPKDLHYHPVPQKSGNIRYVAHHRPNSETYTGPVHYESYHEAHALNTNKATSGHSAYVAKVPALSRPQNSHGFENYNQPALNNNNKNIHVAPINTGLNNFHKKYIQHSIIPSASRYPPINSGHNRLPLHSYRHMENPIIHPQSNHHVRNVHHQAVPLDAILDERGRTGYIQEPIIKKEPHNYAPPSTYNLSPITQNDFAPSNNASNNDVFLKLTNDDGASDTTADENVYDFPEGENEKEFLMSKIKKNFVIIYENGTVEYVNNLNTGDDPDYIAVNDDKPLVPSPHEASYSPSGSKQQISNILDSLPDKINYFDSSVTSNDNNYNNPTLHVDDAYNSQLVSKPLNDFHDDNSSSLPELQQHQDTTPSPLLESTFFEDDPSPESLDGQNPLLRPLTSHGNNYDRDTEPYENGQTDRIDSPYNSIKNNDYTSWPSNLLTHLSSTSTHTQTTPAPDDATTQEFLDSLDVKAYKDQLLSDRNYYSPQDKITPNYNNEYSSGDAHTIIPPSQLHTLISPAIFKSTTSAPDNLEFQKHQDSHFLITDTSSMLPPRKCEDSIEVTTTPSNSDWENNTKSTPVDQIVTISPIELVTDNVKDGPSHTPKDKELLGIDNLYATEKLSNSDFDSKSYDTTTSQPSNQDNLHNTDSVDNILTQVTDRVEIEQHSTESESEDTSSDDTLSVSITDQTGSETDLITEKNDTEGYDYLNSDQTNSDEASHTKNLKLDLSNALVVVNGTTDKDYLNQLLSSDSKINLFIFQMPCQDQEIVEKSKETTIYPNGTCIELLTETRWQNKDDPSPVIITMKKIYQGGKCN